MKKASGWRSQLGAKSERKIAPPSASGVAMTSAMIDVMIVPAIAGAAPNSSGDRVPRARREEAEAELPERRPSREADLDEDEEQQDRHAQREAEDRRAIDAVGDDRPLDGDA